MLVKATRKGMFVVLHRGFVEGESQEDTKARGAQRRKFGRPVIQAPIDRNNNWVFEASGVTVCATGCRLS